MNEAKPSVSEIKPIAVFVDRGAVITQEFVSRDGRILAGYRAIPEAAGFPAWTRNGDIVSGFRQAIYRWFSTENAAHIWTLAQVSGDHRSTPVSDDAAAGMRHAGEAV